MLCDYIFMCVWVCMTTFVCCITSTLFALAYAFFQWLTLSFLILKFYIISESMCIHSFWNFFLVRCRHLCRRRRIYGNVITYYTNRLTCIFNHSFTLYNLIYTPPYVLAVPLATPLLSKIPYNCSFASRNIFHISIYTL